MKKIFSEDRVNYILRMYLPRWNYEKIIEDVIKFCKESGTEHVMGIMQFQYVVEEKFATLKADFERVKGYREQLWSALDKEIYTRLSSEETTPYILSVSARGLRGEILLHMANDKGLIVGTGSACSSNAKHRYSKVILACGYDEKTADGVLRLSFSPQTTESDITQAAEILNEIGRELARKMK